MIKKDINKIQKFAKGRILKSRIRDLKCVIYTRVSTKEQADNNQSLETQKKYCEEFAIKNNLTVSAYFGGTYESAKSDGRSEFNRMIKFVQNAANGISCIIVYSLDRFSRTGGSAINISSQLKALGVTIMSVTQQIDSSSSSGGFQESIHLLFSKYENDLRREKSVSGMKEKLTRGEWIGRAPYIVP
jgi:site-specific DNA recombinase